MPQFEVEMVAFAHAARDYGVRTVDVPEEEFEKVKDDNEVLDLIFKWGQNDFQRRDCPSVSVGDVIRLKGDRYIVKMTGFEKLKKGEDGGFIKGYGFSMPDRK